METPVEHSVGGFSCTLLWRSSSGQIPTTAKPCSAHLDSRKLITGQLLFVLDTTCFSDNRIYVQSTKWKYRKVNKRMVESREERELIDLQGKLRLREAELNKLREDLRRVKSNFSEVEKRFRRLAEAASEGLLIYEQGKIVDVNWSFVSMFGFSQLEIVGINAIEFALPGSSDLIKRKLASGEEHIEEVEAVRKDGSVFMCEIQKQNLILC